MSNYPWFPLFVDLSGRRALVVGAGVVATRRVKTLVQFCGRVDVIAPQAHPDIEAEAAAGRVSLSLRPFDFADLEGADLVVAATDDPDLNARIAGRCRALRIPVNDASDRALCDFYFPGVAVDGGVAVGVTASGGDHRRARAVTERIREALARGGAVTGIGGREAHMRRFFSWLLNLVIARLVFAALLRLFWRFDASGLPSALIAENLEYVKYFTVLSNGLEGLAALLYGLGLALTLCGALPRMPRWVAVLKYVAVTQVCLTLLTVACFIGPRTGFRSAYRGLNFWFHLVVPLLAALDYVFLDREGVPPLRAVPLPLLPVAAYGAFYLGNLLLNGWGGGDHPNDWYGFADAGPAGAYAAFAALLLAALALAALLRRARGRR